MQQAALDVLFNKKTWGGGSTTRRASWYPTTAIGPPDKGPKVMLTVNAETRIDLAGGILDCFDAWPIRRKGPGMKTPPGWWRPTNNEQGRAEAEANFKHTGAGQRTPSEPKTDIPTVHKLN
jgi:hypothetical protein